MSIQNSQIFKEILRKACSWKEYVPRAAIFIWATVLNGTSEYVTTFQLQPVEMVP